MAEFKVFPQTVLHGLTQEKIATLVSVCYFRLPPDLGLVGASNDHGICVPIAVLLPDLTATVFSKYYGRQLSSLPGRKSRQHHFKVNYLGNDLVDKKAIVVSGAFQVSPSLDPDSPDWTRGINSELVLSDKVVHQIKDIYKLHKSRSNVGFVHGAIGWNDVMLNNFKFQTHVDRINLIDLDDPA